MGLFKLLNVFFNVLLCISHPLPNNTKLKMTNLVKVLNVLGQLCLWKHFSESSKFF